MNDFISTIRTDRSREIKKYKDSGYAFIDETKYRLVSTIEVMVEDRTFKFGVQASGRDIYFYIIDHGANLYFSIQDIYKILVDLSYKEGTDFIKNTLISQMNIKIHKDIYSNAEMKAVENQGRFIYKDIEYSIKQTAELEHDGVIMPEGASEEISYMHLFILINLIQEKSNALFLRGGTENEQYVDGLIRFLIVIICINHNEDILNNMGWFWSSGEECFEYKGVKEVTDRSKRKYYLTEDEYRSIMKKES